MPGPTAPGIFDGKTERSSRKDKAVCLSEIGVFSTIAVNPHEAPVLRPLGRAVTRAKAAARPPAYRAAPLAVATYCDRARIWSSLRLAL